MMKTVTTGALIAVPLLVGSGLLAIMSSSDETDSIAVRAPLDEVHSIHCFYGCPSGAQESNDLIFRHAYTMSNNDSTKFADWVAYWLDSLSVSGPNNTNRNWAEDPWLDETETLEEEDYKDANAIIHTDRGHQAPLASFKGTEYLRETNFLSNITAQKSNLNQGPWGALEQKERDLAQTGIDVFVFTGPLYERVMQAMPGADEVHRVPSGYWKIVFVQEGRNLSTVRAASFIFDQETARRDTVLNHLTNILEIEARSGLRFLDDLAVSERDRIAADSFRTWVSSVLD